MSKSEKVWQQFMGTDEVDSLVQLTRKQPPPGVSRRTFLEVLGYSSMALALSGCRAPQQTIVPALKQPAEFTPGVASWFASTCGGCSRACGTLVKVRDGRPIKLEGNPDHPLSAGGLCALAHAQIFGLYDPDRLRQPMIGSKDSKTPSTSVIKPSRPMRFDNRICVRMVSRQFRSIVSTKRS